MKKVVRLTESQLTEIIKRAINEDMEMMNVSSDSDYYKSRKRDISIPKDDLSMLGHFATRYCEDKMGLPDCKTVKDLYYKYNLFM